MSGAGTIPVITLWQPWASLIFARDAENACYKQHETRTFRYPARLEGQEIAIHAAKTWPAWKHISPELHELCLDAFGCSYNNTLPLGGIIGTARLKGCLRTEDVLPDDDDRTAGDWTPGRFAWALGDQQSLDDGKSYMPWKGKQGWSSIPRAALRARAHQEDAR